MRKVFENINDIKIANPLHLNCDYKGNIKLCSVQWHTFQPVNSGSYELICKSTAEMDCYVYDQSGKCNGGLFQENAKIIRLAATLINKNVYYIKIIPSAYGKSILDYRICIKEIKEPIFPHFKRQWSILNKCNGLDINILPVLEYTKQRKIRIGIADSGIYYRHSELKKNVNLDLSYNFVHDLKETFLLAENGFKASAQRGHGTHIAGVIAANQGIMGILPNTDIVSLKVLGSAIQGHGIFNDATNSFVKAVEYAKRNNIKIINCSLKSRPNYTQVGSFIVRTA